jgi:DNA-directed RNA polymerase specialized sigma24 family protein
MRNEVDHILISDIDELDPVCKRAMQMCGLKELSHREAASELGVCVAAIKSRVFTASGC